MLKPSSKAFVIGIGMLLTLAACAEILGLSDFSEGEGDGGVGTPDVIVNDNSDGQSNPSSDFCSNAVFDPDAGETDVDCGGPCGKCAKGKKCKSDKDCAKFCNIADGGVCDGCEGFTIPDAAPACIDGTEVRVRDFDEFVKNGPKRPLDSANGRCRAISKPADFDLVQIASPNHPVRNVDWCTAKTYCLWRGKKLCGSLGRNSPLVPNTAGDPTHSQWLAACTGTSRNQYPYLGGYEKLYCNGIDLGLNGPWDAGSRAACQNVVDPGADFQVFDMSGNVAEWEDACDSLGGRDECNVRGGSYLSDGGNMRCQSIATRNPNSPAPDVGFRCCE